MWNFTFRVMKFYVFLLFEISKKIVLYQDFISYRIYREDFISVVPELWRRYLSSTNNVTSNDYRCYNSGGKNNNTKEYHYCHRSFRRLKTKGCKVDFQPSESVYREQHDPGGQRRVRLSNRKLHLSRRPVLGFWYGV